VDMKSWFFATQLLNEQSLEPCLAATRLLIGTPYNEEIEY
jgi:hypothetical protein